MAPTWTGLSQSMVFSWVLRGNILRGKVLKANTPRVQDGNFKASADLSPQKSSLLVVFIGFNLGAKANLD